MKIEAIKEKLKYYNSFNTNIWASLVVLSGGLSSLLLDKLDSNTKILLFSIGAFVETCLIIGLLFCIYKVRYYTRKLNEVKE
jgi:hypothetical protein